MIIGHSRAASAGSPPTLTGLIAWYDASVTASLTRSGSIITNVADQSGQGNHLGDGTTSGRPTYNATGFNTSYPTMNFSAQSIQSTSTFPMGTGNTLTFALVGTFLNTSQTNGRAISYLKSPNTDFSNAGSWIFLRNVNTANVGIMRNSVTAIAGVSFATPYRFIGTISSGGAMTFYVNGVSSGTGTSGGNWLSPGTLALGISVWDGSLWDGAMSEVIIATGFSDATAVAALDTYLKNKWGL